MTEIKSKTKLQPDWLTPTAVVSHSGQNNHSQQSSQDTAVRDRLVYWLVQGHMVPSVAPLRLPLMAAFLTVGGRAEVSGGPDSLSFSGYLLQNPSLLLLAAVCCRLSFPRRLSFLLCDCGRKMKRQREREREGEGVSGRARPPHRLI